MKDSILIKIKKALNRFISKLFNNKKDISNEEIFLHQWTLVLKDNASVFNGLYNGLQKIADGKAKKPESVIAEWWTRTRYKWGKSAYN